MGLTAEPDDERVMRLALVEARTCLEHGDVPIVAAVTRGDDVLAAVGNRREIDGDPTAHAEILALRAASAALGSTGGCSERPIRRRDSPDRSGTSSTIRG